MDDCQQQYKIKQQQNIKQMDQSIKLVEETTNKVKNLNISTFQRWKGCDKLKNQLLEVLIQIKANLKSFKKVVIYQAKKLKNKINLSALSKYFMEMNAIMKTLIGVCIVSIVSIFGYLGWKLGSLIPLLQTGYLAQWVGTQLIAFGSLGVAIGIGVVLITADILYSLWQASKNKQKFEIAVSQAKKALNQIQEKIQIVSDNLQP